MQNDGWYRYEHSSLAGGHGGPSGSGEGAGSMAIAATGGSVEPAVTSDASKTSDMAVTGRTSMRRGSSRTGKGGIPPTVTRLPHPPIPSRLFGLVARDARVAGTVMVQVTRSGAVE